MIACTLLAMVGGYFVFAHASALKGEVRSVGRVVGIIVMAVALAGVVCGVACKAGNMSCGVKGGGMMSKGFCPVIAKGK